MYGAKRVGATNQCRVEQVFSPVIILSDSEFFLVQLFLFHTFFFLIEYCPLHYP